MNKLIVTSRLILCTLLCGSALLLSGCAPKSQVVIKHIKYHKSLDMNIQENAVLVWRPGKIRSATMIDRPSEGGGIVSLSQVIASEIAHKTNPDQYIFAYGKSQQAVFMTSLESVLDQNNAFSSISLLPYPLSQTPKGVEIMIYFKRTIVGSQDDGFPVTLVVTMTINDHGHSVTHNYYVESKAAGFFSKNSFADQMQNVSTKLMAKVLKDMQSWANKQSAQPTPTPSHIIDKTREKHT